MEYVILNTTERDGLVYQLCAEKIDATVLDQAETVQTPAIVIVRKPLT